MNGRNGRGEIDGSYERVNVKNLPSGYSKFCGWRQSYEDLNTRSYVYTTLYFPFIHQYASFCQRSLWTLDVGRSTLDVGRSTGFNTYDYLQ